MGDVIYVTALRNAKRKRAGSHFVGMAIIKSDTDRFIVAGSTAGRSQRKPKKRQVEQLNVRIFAKACWSMIRSRCTVRTSRESRGVRLRGSCLHTVSGEPSGESRWNRFRYWQRLENIQ